MFHTLLQVDLQQYIHDMIYRFVHHEVISVRSQPHRASRIPNWAPGIATAGKILVYDHPGPTSLSRRAIPTVNHRTGFTGMVPNPALLSRNSGCVPRGDHASAPKIEQSPVESHRAPGDQGLWMRRLLAQQWVDVNYNDQLRVKVSFDTIVHSPKWSLTWNIFNNISYSRNYRFTTDNIIAFT